MKMIRFGIGVLHAVQTGTVFDVMGKELPLPALERVVPGAPQHVVLFPFPVGVSDVHPQSAILRKGADIHDLTELPIDLRVLKILLRERSQFLI